MRDAIWNAELAGFGNIVLGLHGDVRCSHERGTFKGVWSTKSIVKHLGLGKRVSCAKNGWTDVNDLYSVRRMTCFTQGVAFGVAMIAPTLKFLVALFFKIAIKLNSLTR